jgi:uncharacterized protein
MPKSKIFLPDVNFWLAFCVDRHAHHDAAVAWFAGVGAREAAFCRVTQMGLLRLLTNVRVMGEDVLSEEGAWRVYEQLARDMRVVFLNEPEGIEEPWRSITGRRRGGSARWTDAYLQAFASLCDSRVVTFDRGFEAWGEPAAEVLN